MTEKIFNISAFDPLLGTWIIDRYLNDQDLAIAQAQRIARNRKDLWICVKAHKNRRDHIGEIVWESNYPRIDQ